MAIKKKKEAPPGKPVVSKIPMPPSDSALVIDLPDGQKLVVGKMEHGTVIEVATWRGTGRPDSRTNRMMLGMTNAELEASIEAAASDEAPSSNQELKSGIGSIKKDPKQFILNLLSLSLAGIKWLFNFKDQFGEGPTVKKQSKNIVQPKATEIGNQPLTRADESLNSDAVDTNYDSASKFDFKTKFKNREGSKPKATKVDSSGSNDSDVEDWLDQIMTKTQAKVAKSAASEVKTEPTAKTSAVKPKAAAKKSTKRR